MSSPEEKYPPKPGGMVDTTRKERAAGHAQAQTEPQAPKDDYRAIKVDVIEPETCSGRTVVVSTGAGAMAVRQILGQDKNRKRALVWTLDEPVVICNSLSAADDSRNATNAAGASAGGAVLPINVPMPIMSRGEVFVAATSSTATRVAVWVESYADPSA